MSGWLSRLFPSRPKVGPAQAQELQARGAILLDVREDTEWQAGHAPKARHIPLSRLPARLPGLPANRTVIIPTPEMRVSFSAAPPRGLHRIRASFTSARTNPSHVRYSTRHGEGDWTSAIQIDIRGYPVRDVAVTTLYIR